MGGAILAHGSHPRRQQVGWASAQRHGWLAEPEEPGLEQQPPELQPAVILCGNGRLDVSGGWRWVVMVAIALWSP